MNALTFHAVDDAPQISAPEYLLQFTEVFVFPLLLSKLSADGREARFRIMDHSRGQAYEKRANRIINCMRLPLEASLKVNEVGGLTFETILVIKYTGK